MNTKISWVLRWKKFAAQEAKTDNYFCIRHSAEIAIKNRSEVSTSVRSEAKSWQNSKVIVEKYKNYIRKEWKPSNELISILSYSVWRPENRLLAVLREKT